MRLSPILMMLLVAAAGRAQTTDPGPSVAEAARSARKRANSAAPKVTDDSPGLSKFPIPDVFSDGIDNTDQILRAIDQYRKTHTLAATEGTVHAWYDRHDAMLKAAIAENRVIEDKQMSGEYSRMFDSSANDYQQYAQRQAQISKLK